MRHILTLLALANEIPDAAARRLVRRAAGRPPPSGRPRRPPRSRRLRRGRTWTLYRPGVPGRTARPMRNGNGPA